MPAGSLETGILFLNRFLMSKHEKRLLSILTVNRYVTDIIDIINEILTDAPDSTLVLFNFYARDFRQIK